MQYTAAELATAIKVIEADNPESPLVSSYKVKLKELQEVHELAISAAEYLADMVNMGSPSTLPKWDDMVEYHQGNLVDAVAHLARTTIMYKLVKAVNGD